MQFVVVLLSVFSIFSAYALVDTKSGNYKKTFVDFNLEGSAFPLTLERSYNSRSLYRGLFGVGWCSNIETKVDVLPDNSIKLTECGGGQEVSFLTRNSKQNVPTQVEQIIKVVKSQNKSFSDSYFEGLRQKLLRSSVLRNEFLRAYKVRGKAVSGQVYFAEGRSGERLTYNKKGYFQRNLQSGVQQFFSQSHGRLVQVSDRTGNYIKIVWKGDQPQYMTDQQGRRVMFYYDNKGQIRQIKGLGKALAAYRIDDGNLVYARNQEGVYRHKYDDLHNLVLTMYPGNKKSPPQEKLSYNTQRDWVTSFQNRRKCVETYKYEINPKNSNHYWTDVQKKCGKTVTNVSRYEFWNKKGPDGSLYLHRARQDVNKDVRDITYHPKFKRASSITQNGVRTQYEFYEEGVFQGLLKKKRTNSRQTLFTNYHRKCKKPTKVSMQTVARKKVTNQQSINIVYDSSTCLMRRASRSDGKWVALSHDEKGRIEQMKDQTGKTISIVYNNRWNKPQRLTQKGVGSVELRYSRTGESQGWKQGNDPVVMSQVLSVFNSLVGIINPVAQEMSI